MKKILTILLSTLLITSLLFAGCSKETPADSKNASEDTNKGTSDKSNDDSSKEEDSNAEVKKIASLVSGGEPGSLDPALAQGNHESVILDHVFEGLMKRDNEGNIVNGMAADYKVSEDKLTYTFTIRDDAKWSNGEKVVAEDFEKAWKRALDPNTASDYAYQLYYLKGGEAFNTYDLEAEGASEEEFKSLEEAVGVTSVNEKTLEVQLQNPTPYFLELCAFYTYYPTCAKVQEENPDWAKEGSTHVGNGAFKIVSWDHDSEVDVVKNENYYDAENVKLEGINFIISEDQNTQWQMYENNEIDLDQNIPTEILGKLRAEKNPELLATPELSTYFYRFNTTRKPFNNVKVRKALSMAIDRQSLIDNVAKGGQFKAFALVPGGIPDFEGDFRENGGDYFEENFEDAQKLLAEGLKEEGMDSLEFSILYNTDEAHKKIATAIQDTWNQLEGVNVTLENTEFKVKIDREHNLDFDVSRAGWIGDYVDPNTFLDMYTSWSSQNDTGWTSDAYDKLIKDASTEFDPQKRMEYLHEAEEMLMENIPIMPIYYYVKNITIKPNLKGVYKAVNREPSLIYAEFVPESE